MPFLYVSALGAKLGAYIGSLPILRKKDSALCAVAPSHSYATDPIYICQSTQDSSNWFGADRRRNAVRYSEPCAGRPGGVEE